MQGIFETDDTIDDAVNTLSDEILRDLTITVSKLRKIPLSSLKAISSWESSTKARDLIVEAEEITQSITHHTRKIPKIAGVPNFDKASVLVVWETTQPTPPVKERSLRERRTKLARIESDLVHMSRESVFKDNRRQPVPRIDIETNGKFRGKQFHGLFSNFCKISQAQGYVTCPWCSGASKQTLSNSQPLVPAG